MLASPATSILALPKSHSFSAWLLMLTSRFWGLMSLRGGQRAGQGRAGGEEFAQRMSPAPPCCQLPPPPPYARP